NRPKMIQGLTQYFTEHKTELCKDCHWRLEKNVLRIFDCKIESCQPVVQGAPWEDILPLSEDFKKLTADLRHCNIPFEIHRRLVRGLDYYNGIVFEVTAEGLGAQDAIAGGGRYDQLYEELGGTQVPCTGFSVGLERLIMSLEKSSPPLSERILREKVYFAPVTEGLERQTQSELLQWMDDTVRSLLESGVRVILGETSLSLSDHLKRANKTGIRFVVIAGSKELQEKVWTCKNMSEQKQETVAMGDLLQYLKGKPAV
ncbi:MAG TPA: ATP phosphoribosyltransferase regulatory subunit, partial [bacterium]|nr:ATP phosphoribosyltransferase regulatory subunit [bacterium]